MRRTLSRSLAGVTIISASIYMGVFLKGAAAQTTASPTDQQMIADGKKLVDANGCAACHTAPNAAPFSGNVLGAWNAPPLLNNVHDGIGSWSVDDIATYLLTGHNAFAEASGPMGDVITNTTSKLSAADAGAIGAFLKSLKGDGAVAREPIAKTNPQMVFGARIYANECSACHTQEGTGAPNLFPSLKASPVVEADNPVTLMQVVLHGAQSVGTASAAAVAMPAFGGQLSDEQIADVLTYIRNSWGNAAPAVTAETIKAAR